MTIQPMGVRAVKCLATIGAAFVLSQAAGELVVAFQTAAPPRSEISLAPAVVML